jgi:DNA polymerase V
MRELTDLYRPGYPFNKAGIMLTGLSPGSRQQLNLFASSEESGNESVMKALDQVNDRWGRDMLRYASSGLIREWSMKQTRKSPAYTTSWGELPVANALKLRMGTE